MRYRFAAGIAVTIAALVAMGQAAIQTFPPNTVWGRIGVGQFGPGSAIPLSTLGANLGFGTPSHSVPIGKGTTVGGFNSAPTGTSGAVLVDQGSGNDPAFVGVTGSCTLAANGAIACSGVGAGVTAITANYSAQASDCLKTISVSGGTQITLSFASAATFGACTIDVINNNSWSNPAGVLMSVTGLVTNPPVLYPGMSLTLINIGGVWAQKPGAVQTRAPLGTKLYVDGVNGLDSNDCLSTATACKTLNWVGMHVIWESLLASSGSATGGTPGFNIRLIDDPGCNVSTGANCIASLHWSGYPKQIEGHNAIRIECDSGSATNCTIADNSGGISIGVYAPINLELKNVALGCTANAAMQVERALVYIDSGVVMRACAGSGNPMLNTIYGGRIVMVGGATLTIEGGSGGPMAQATFGGGIHFDSATVSFTNDATFSSTLQALGGTITSNSTTWSTNGHTITAGANVQCSIGGFIDTNGTIASIPGTNTPLGCTNSANGQVH